MDPEVIVTKMHRNDTWLCENGDKEPVYVQTKRDILFFDSCNLKLWYLHDFVDELRFKPNAMNTQSGKDHIGGLK